MTPPFHTSSPEHERYTPPSERRRGQLFDEEGFIPKNVVGPRNLLEVCFKLSFFVKLYIPSVALIEMVHITILHHMIKMK